ncbi:MAG: hypothetical protein PHC61_03295 [Chitinivibrionales bacterium]|nr:hypothetical protein [Chitinivibrionales bacterium]
MRPKTKSVLGVGLWGLLLLAACDFSYQPVSFVPPKPPFTFASGAAVENFIGTRNAKVAFTLKKTLSVQVVDFNDTATDETRQAVTLKKPAGKETYSSDSPLFSPDGGWVTYFVYTGEEDCVPYVQQCTPDALPIQVTPTASPAGNDPHWWVDPAAPHDTFIVYADKFRTNLNSLATLTGSATYKRKITRSGASATFGPVVTIAPKPFTGGISPDGAFLCTGYADAALWDVGAAKLYPVNSGKQVCNPSICPDPAHPDWMMFLCFDGVQNLDETAINRTLGAVREHQIIYVVDKSNRVQWFINKDSIADNNTEFQDPEWSNKTDFLMALAGNAGESNYDCYIIKRSTGDKLSLLSSSSGSRLNDTSTPSLWIGN